MKISIVVPAYNEEKLLPATLDAIRSASRSFDENGCEWELIVCDNNSTDQTAAVAVSGGARVVFEPLNQIARARNTGARAARGEWLIFVDADSHPSRGLFDDVLREIRSGRTLAGGATLQMDAPEWPALCLVHVWNLASRLKRRFAGSFIYFETRSFRALGGFDETLFASEEIELSKRACALADAEGRAVRILHSHPLVTSARKLRLYSKREHLKLLWQTIKARGRNLREREACTIWYDGRR